MAHKHYYVGHSYMGLTYTYASSCWEVLAFDSRAERTAWLKDWEYYNGNLVAESISAAEARKIAPELACPDLDMHDRRRQPSRVSHMVLALDPDTGEDTWGYL